MVQKVLVGAAERAGQALGMSSSVLRTHSSEHHEFVPNSKSWRLHYTLHIISILEVDRGLSVQVLESCKVLCS